jgi:alpha-glucosidase
MAKRSDNLRFFTMIGGKSLADDVLAYEKAAARNDQRYSSTRPPAGPWRILGAVEKVYHDGPLTLRLECEHGWVEIHWIASNCVRVRMSANADTLTTPPFSYSVSKTEWPAVQVKTEVGVNEIVIKSGDLTCRVGRKPLRIALQSPDDTLLSVDSTGMQQRSDGAVRLTMKMHSEETSYGMGTRASGLNLRGKRLMLWNADAPEYTRGTDPLYCSVPFYLGVHSGGAYGVFWNNSFRGVADLGKTVASEMSFEAEGGELCYYLFGGDVNSILARYSELTGRISQPPLWALGYQQSRVSYYPQEAVAQLAYHFRARGIPCDVIHLDLYYMDGFRVFTWNATHFPDLKKLIADLHRDGFKVIANVHPGVKIDADYTSYQTGIMSDVFVKLPDDERMTAVTWSGSAHLPDFTSPAARAWWVGECAKLLWLGVDGLSNDLGEPVIFMPDAPGTLPDYVVHEQEGQGSTHLESHNVYGLLMGRATAEALEKYRRNLRPVNIIRAGFAGAQRYAMVSTGENAADWDHLRLMIPMILNLGLSGMPLLGADVGGFRGDTGAELFTRWLQAACLMPFFRARTALGTTPQEPWSFGQPYEVINRLTIELRYRLMPYLYAVIAQAREYGWPVIRPLFTSEPDNLSLRAIDDCYLLGDAVLVAPVLQQGAVSRAVYLPAGEWYDFWTNERLEGGEIHEITAPLERLPLFIRAGAVIPLWPEMLHTGEKPIESLTLRLYPGEHESILYEDKGDGLEYLQGQYRWIYITSRWDDDTLMVNRRVAGTFEPSYKSIRLEVVGFDDEPAEVRVDRQGAPLWFFDDDVLELKVGEFKQVEITRKPRTADKTLLHRPWEKK